MTKSGSYDFCLEQAVSPEAHSRGLMYRRSLMPKGGMIFIFDKTMPRQFWMQNTYIPLDMIFVGADLQVVGVITDAQPLSERPRGPATPCRYVVELAGGTAERLGIGVGTPMRLGAPTASGSHP